MEPVTEDDPTPSGEIPELSEPVKDIAQEFKSLAVEIKKRQAQDADAAQHRQDELKAMYRKGQRNGILWGFIFILLVGGALFAFSARQSNTNADLTGSIKDLTETQARRTPTLNYIVCHDQKQDMYMITLGVLLLAQLDGTDDTVQRSWFEKSIEDLAHATDPESPDSCPVAPTEGEKK